MLASEYGIRQFTGTGSGLPPAQNTNEAEQAVAPDPGVTYAGNDREVTLHARTLLMVWPGARARKP